MLYCKWKNKELWVRTLEIHVSCVHCKCQTKGQQFVVRSEIFETFRFLDQCQLSPEKKNQHMCCHLELHTCVTDEGPSFHWFDHGFVVKKRPHLTYIYRTYMITFKQGKKRAERLQLPETALPKDKMWMANGKSDHWSLVMELHIFRNKCGSKTLL